MSKKTGHD